MACLALMSMETSLRAQDTNASADVPAPPVISQPAPTTNFLDQPSSGAPGLSVQSPAAETESIPSAPSNPESSNLAPDADEVDHLADHLLVVYNQNDPDSKSLAEYYASCRAIPEERVLAISCSGNEEITHDEYEKTIRRPILFYLLQKKWMTRKNSQFQLGSRVITLITATHNDIWAIVLMRGVPLKIAPDPTDDDVMENDLFFKANGVPVDPNTLSILKTNAAAVDSELALLPTFGLPRGGFVPNGFFDPKATGERRLGSELAKNMILVSRLDGPTPAQVKRMIDDSLYAEKNRLAGLAVIDTRGVTDTKSGTYSGDVWLRDARNMLLQDGWVVSFDEKPEVIPATEPLNEVALYLGWYSDHAEGPWITPPNRFARGAIAYHLHSYSAATVRSETNNWVGPLIAHGASASMGTVYEPLLGWTPHEDIFTKRLLDGNYFVEAAYASQLGLSWMTTVVGDPLYRPFLAPLGSVVATASLPHTDHDDWLLLQQIRRAIVTRKLDLSPDRLRESIEIPGVGPVAEEGLGDLLVTLNDPHSIVTADQAYQKAADAYDHPIDRIRIGIKMSNYYRSHNKPALAQSQLDMLRQLFPDDAVRFGLVSPPVANAPAPVAANQPPSSPRKYPQQSPTSGLPVPPKPPLPPFPHPVSQP
jgi:uncharacterized protein (TIGR03790 family)